MDSTGAVFQSSSVKKAFLKILQKSQKNTCTGKHKHRKTQKNTNTRLRPATLLHKRLWHRCFAVKFAEFLKTRFFAENLWWLLLDSPENVTSQMFISYRFIKKTTKSHKSSKLNVTYLSLSMTEKYEHVVLKGATKCKCSVKEIHLEYH